jgi:hypothetical protein
LKTAFNIGLPLHKFQFINNYAQLLGISLSENKVVIVDAKGQKVLLSESTGNKPNDFVIKK